MGNKVLAYDRDGHRVWLQGRKVWIEDPSGQLYGTAVPETGEVHLITLA
jgi:hypothetical protein